MTSTQRRSDNETIMISIIIPCYNGSLTLAKAIESALSQTFPDKEIIVVDDGSTDRSAEVIKSFGRAIISEFGPNQGLSAARNRGTRLARGKYIQNLDADDILTPDTLVKRVEALERTGADIAYTDWREFSTDADGFLLTGHTRVRPLDVFRADAEAACASSAFWAPPAAILYRRWVADAVGAWNTRLAIVNDVRFLFDAARAGARFTRVEGVGVLYRVSPESLSRRSPEDFVKDCFVNAADIQAIWQSAGCVTAARRDALIQMWSYIATSTFRNNLPEFRPALQHLTSISEQPHLDMQLRLFLSSIVGQPAIWGIERRIRGLLSPLRQLFSRVRAGQRTS
jgi:Glycosyl transferase family 2